MYSRPETIDGKMKWILGLKTLQPAATISPNTPCRSEDHVNKLWIKGEDVFLLFPFSGLKYRHKPCSASCLQANSGRLSICGDRKEYPTCVTGALVPHWRLISHAPCFNIHLQVAHQIVEKRDSGKPSTPRWGFTSSNSQIASVPLGWKFNGASLCVKAT